MKLNSWLGLVAVATSLLLVWQVADNGVDALPGRKNKNKDFDNNKGGKNVFNNNNAGWASNTGVGSYKKKGGAMKTLKKAAVIGAVAYGGYQIGKLTGKFGSWGSRGSWGFNDWNKWREIDGFMCRDDNDCKWIDQKLDCQDYELDFTPSALWFGGDIARIVGECSCPPNTVWNESELQCDSNLFLGLTTTILTVVIVLAVLFTFCCCICGFLICRKFM